MQLQYKRAEIFNQYLIGYTKTSESDPGKLKWLIKPVLEFESMKSAHRTIFVFMRYLKIEKV
jgi:hypothetical protein